MHKGLFIVLEGIDGAGKTLQAELAASRLVRLHRLPVLQTREPTLLTREGRLLRSMKTRNRIKEIQYFLRDRVEHLKLVTPAREHGAVVICDRYMASTAVYQSDTPQEAATLYATLAEMFPTPDHTIFLDLTVQQASARWQDRGQGIGPAPDAQAFEGLASMEAVYERYHYLADLAGSRWDRVDASQSQEAVYDKVSELLDQYLATHGIKIGGGAR